MKHTKLFRFASYKRLSASLCQPPGTKLLIIKSAAVLCFLIGYTKISTRIVGRRQGAAIFPKPIKQLHCHYESTNILIFSPRSVHSSNKNSAHSHNAHYSVAVNMCDDMQSMSLSLMRGYVCLNGLRRQHTTSLQSKRCFVRVALMQVLKRTSIKGVMS